MGADLLSIGDMAKITGMSIQALRYYDRKGILKPAHVNEKTGYRYYTPGQLLVIDAIQTSLELGIPLKEAHSMIDEDVFDARRFFERGIDAARERMRQASIALEVSEDFLADMLDDGAHLDCSYETEMPESVILSAPWEHDDFDALSFDWETRQIFNTANGFGMVPYYRYGLWKSAGLDEGWRVFAAVLCQKEKALGDPQEPRLDTIRAGSFRVQRETHASFADGYRSLLGKAAEFEGEALIRERCHAHQDIGQFTVELLTRIPVVASS